MMYAHKPHYPAKNMANLTTPVMLWQEINTADTGLYSLSENARVLSSAVQWLQDKHISQRKQ